MAKVERWTLAALVAGIALMVAACGGEEPKGPSPGKIEAAQKGGATPPPGEEPPPNADREIRYEGKTQMGESFSAQMGGDVELPASFGSDVPDFPGATATSAMETVGGTAIAALDSEADQDDIVDFYRARLIVMVHEVDIQNGSFRVIARSAMPSPAENRLFTTPGAAQLSVTVDSATDSGDFLLDDTTDAGPYFNVRMLIDQTTGGERNFADISVAMLLRAGG